MICLHLQQTTIYKLFLLIYGLTWLPGFPDSSVGKESACNAGEPGSIPGSGRSAGEGIGYPLQYSWASLVVQLVKNLPATWETWVRSLGWEDPLEKGKVTHSSILAWSTPWTVQSMGPQSQTRLSDFHFHMASKKKKNLERQKKRQASFHIISYHK